MKFSIGYYLGISIKIEIILLTICGMLCAMFDESLMDLSKNLREIWSTDLSPQHFTPFTQQVIKFLITGIVVIRSFTVHLYLAFYVVMIWPAIFEEKPGLLLPWLVIGGIKNLLVGAVSCCIGLFVCLVSGGFSPACGKFVIKQISRLGPSCYMWYTVLRYYRILRSVRRIDEACVFQESQFNLEKALRRRKVRSMRSDYSLRQKLIKDHLCISASNYEYQMPEVSIGSSVEPIPNADEITCTPLKVSRSLDALLSMILSCSDGEDEIQESEENALQIDESMSPVEKTKRLLRLTDSDINIAKQNKEIRNDMLMGLNANVDLCVQIAAHLRTFHNYPESIARKVASEKELKTINMDNIGSDTLDACCVDWEQNFKEKVFAKFPVVMKTKLVSSYHLIPGTSTKLKNINSVLLRNCKHYDKTNECKQLKSTNNTKTLNSNNIECKKSVNNLNVVPKKCLSCGGCIHNNDNKHKNELSELSPAVKAPAKEYQQDAACQVSNLSQSFLENKSLCDLLSRITSQTKAPKTRLPVEPINKYPPSDCKMKSRQLVNCNKIHDGLSKKHYHKFAFVNCGRNIHVVRSACFNNC